VPNLGTEEDLSDLNGASSGVRLPRVGFVVKLEPSDRDTQAMYDEFEQLVRTQFVPNLPETEVTIDQDKVSLNCRFSCREAIDVPQTGPLKTSTRMIYGPCLFPLLTHMTRPRMVGLIVHGNPTLDKAPYPPTIASLTARAYSAKVLNRFICRKGSLRCLEAGVSINRTAMWL
jgi:hypothetical protein